MKSQEIKFKGKSHKYSIILGKNSINILPKKVKSLCPKSKNIAFIIDNNVPIKFKTDLKTSNNDINVTYFILLLHLCNIIRI